MKNFKKISIHLLVLSIFLVPFFVYGQPTGVNNPNPTGVNNSPPIAVHIDNPFKGGNDLMSLITALLNNVVMPIAAVVVVMWIIWAGFGYLMAQGKPAEIQKANQRLLWSLIGAGILLGAAAISKVVETTINALTK